MAITIGSVEVDVIPNTTGIYQHLKDALVPAATKAGKDAGEAAGRAFGPAMQAKVGDIGLSIGEQIGQQIANKIKDAVSDALKTGITIGGQKAKGAASHQGEETGGAFARTLRAKLVEAFRAMPKLDISLADSGVDAELARLRARMETLSNKRIGVDVDVAAADAEVADISERLQRLGAAHPNVAVRADTAAARAALAQIREEIDRVSAQHGTVRLETDGSFGARLRAAVRSAEASLPNINIGADTSPAQAELVSLRARLTALRDQRIGIDIDAGTASAQIDQIRARLATLAASAPNIAVRVDAATAEAQLAQVEAIADAVDANEIDLHVSNRQALSAIFQVAIAIGALAAIPAIPILAAGTGSLVAAFATAGVGVGAFAAAAIPAISNIKGALDAQKQAQDASTSAATRGGQAAAQAASKALQMAGAQQALASAERNAARQIAQAQQQVVQARRAVGDAVEQAALRQQQAARAVAQADRQVVTSTRSVAQAEDQLVQGQRDAIQAQDDLTAARKTASEQLVDLNNRLADGRLSQERAVMAVAAAEKELLNDQQHSGSTSSAKLAEDRLTLAEAKQALLEQQIATKRLADETTAANKAGVEGSKTVSQAQKAVADAQQGVADKTQAVADAQQGLKDAQQGLAEAQQDQARTQVQNARSIADAQAKVADAARGVADAQAAAADSIASAQRQVQSASLSAAGGVDASATAAQKYRAALAKLSPSARGTFNAFVGLRTAFKAWSLSLQPKTMPIFTRALNGVKNSLPGLTPLVTGAASAISTLQDKISKGFKSPWWKEFKADFADSVEPAIVGVGVALGNVFVGTAGIIDAFLLHIDSISNRMDRVTGRFANFGKNLKGSPEFENFLSYSSEEAPKLADALGKIGGAFVDVAKAAAPLSGPVLATLGAIAVTIGNLAESTPGAIQLMYALFVVTKLFKLAQLGAAAATVVYQSAIILATLLTQGWTAATIASNAAFEANPIVAIVTIIIVALVLLVAGILYAWNHWAWFRTAVLGVWHAIQFAALWAWNNVLKPTFNAIATAAIWLWTNAIKPTFAFIVAAFHGIADVAVWVWQSVLAPMFSAIGAIIAWFWKYVVKPYFAMVKFAFQTWAALVMFVYNKVVKPIFAAIGVVIAWWWNNVVKRYFSYARTALSALGTAMRYLYDHYAKPVFSWIGSAISSAWRNVIRPSFDGLKTAIRKVGEAFGTAKDAIGRHWDKIKNLTKKPVNFVIKSVWNEGIVSVWKKIGGWIPGLPKLGKLPLLEAGGTVPAIPGMFNRPTAIVGEGNPRYPEYVIPTDPKYRKRALDLHQSAGTQLLAGGGILGGIADVAGRVGSAAWSGAKGAVNFLADPVAGLMKLLGPITNKLKPLTKSPWGKMIAKLPTMAIKGLKGLVGLGGNSGGGGDVPAGSGVQRWLPTVIQALSLLHQPTSWSGTVLRRMNQESGGNPRAVNLWDSNAKAGYPSTGLMQVIRPTFQHNAGMFRDKGPFMYGVSIDPLANTYAGLHYALGRYGSLAALNRPGGYDSGGYLQPGLNLAYNGTGRPEPVFTRQQANALTGMAGVRGAAGNDGPVRVEVIARDRVLEDLIDVRVYKATGELVTVLDAGGGN